jgi:Fe-S oxidoreductase
MIMTTLQQARAQTTEAFLAEAGPRLAALCTACGACFAACPMVDHIGLRSADARAATAGLAGLARGETAPADTLAWVGACARSGLCVTACPERDKGLDAMLLVRIAKQRAINDTRQLKPKQDQALFPRVKIFARLQLSDEELAKWM